jgi:MCM P-loop domain
MDLNVLRRFVDNIIFAMNLSNEIPEHIRQEIIRKEKLRLKVFPDVNELNVDVEERFGVKSKSEPRLEPKLGSAIEQDPELTESLIPDDVNAFNAEVEQKLGKQPSHRLQPQIGEQRQKQEPEEEFFDEIVGYGDIKKIMLKCLLSSEREPIHVILDGPPATAKSLFLLQMNGKLENAYYADCTNMTGPGIVKYLFENDVEFLFLDEVEKMNRNEQNVLLNVMETGILTSTKVKQTRTKKIKLSIFATTNDIDALNKPFRSRFMEFSLPPYTYDEFCEIAVKLLEKRYGHNEELSLKIADAVWNGIKSTDVRDMLAIGKLSDSVEWVDFVAQTLQKYKRRDDEYEGYD